MAQTLAPICREDAARRSKLGMYCQRLSERPRIIKHVLVSSPIHIPDSKHKPKSKCSPGSPTKGLPEFIDDAAKKGRHETLTGVLEHEFMETLAMTLENSPDDTKHPILRASHPGGQVFKTKKLGAVVRPSHDHKPFDLTKPNAPANRYSCYYDKHLNMFFSKPVIRQKLIEQGIISEDNFIREPYKIFKEQKSNPLPVPQTPLPVKIPSLREQGKPLCYDTDVKKFVQTNFNLNPEVVEQIYSMVRSGSVLPDQDPEDGTGELARRSPTPLPSLRCQTAMKLDGVERTMQNKLHHSRIDAVLARRNMQALEKKSRAIEQGLIKQEKFGNNKRQMELERWENSLNRLRTTFSRKKSAIFHQLERVEEQKNRREDEKIREVDKLKKKFASAFIEQGLAERKVKAARQQLERDARNRNKAWLEKQREERERHLADVNKRIHNICVKQLATITSNKTNTIAQLELKCEYYDEDLAKVQEENTHLNNKLAKLHKMQKSQNSNL